MKNKLKLGYKYSLRNASTPMALKTSLGKQKGPHTIAFESISSITTPTEGGCRATLDDIVTSFTPYVTRIKT